MEAGGGGGDGMVGCGGVRTGPGLEGRWSLDDGGGDARVGESLTNWTKSSAASRPRIVDMVAALGVESGRVARFELSGEVLGAAGPGR